MAQTDRDVLFANEAFLIGVLQAVSAGAIVAALSQSEPLLKLAGKYPYLIFVTGVALALLAAVLAAYSKHQYKMWDVKCRASSSRGEEAEAVARGASANFHPSLMRGSMFFALLLIFSALLELLCSMWIRAIAAPYAA